MFPSINSRLAEIYISAKKAVIAAGYHHEIDWQSSVRIECVTETDFLREAAWVILSAGFRESVLRRKFPCISVAFQNWSSARAIIDDRALCRKKALSVFANVKKIDAIIQIAAQISKIGFKNFRSKFLHGGIAFLQTLPFIGSITSFHLAKNIGLNVVKPDRHLVRAAQAAGVSCPQTMCQMIHEVVGDPIAVIDVVIWRYATFNPRYSSEFATASFESNFLSLLNARVSSLTKTGVFQTCPT